VPSVSVATNALPESGISGERCRTDASPRVSTSGPTPHSSGNASAGRVSSERIQRLQTTIGAPPDGVEAVLRAGNLRHLAGQDLRGGIHPPVPPGAGTPSARRRFHAPRSGNASIKGRLDGPHRSRGTTWTRGWNLLARSIEAREKSPVWYRIGAREGYLQDGWTARRLHAHPGGRLSWNSRWGRAVTPSLAAAYDVSPSLRLRAGAARVSRIRASRSSPGTFPIRFDRLCHPGKPRASA
jgi:hypothetical protein